MTEREISIKELRLRGETLQSIGDQFGITKERTRQILKKLDIRKPALYEKINDPVPYNTKIKQRLLRRIEITDEDCWLYTGYKSPLGYGWISYKGHTQYAHRVSYQVFNEKVLKSSEGMSSETTCVLHICRNKACINPDHLYLGTALERYNNKKTIDK